MPDGVILLLSLIFGAAGAAAFQGLLGLRERAWRQEAERQTREVTRGHRPQVVGPRALDARLSPRKTPRVDRYGELVE